MNNTTNNLLACFTEALGVESDLVTDKLAYQSIPEWDSIGHMALVAEIEDTFDIMLDTDDILNMSNVAITKSILKQHGVKLDVT